MIFSKEKKNKKPFPLKINENVVFKNQKTVSIENPNKCQGWFFSEFFWYFYFIIISLKIRQRCRRGTPQGTRENVSRILNQTPYYHESTDILGLLPSPLELLPPLVFAHSRTRGGNNSRFSKTVCVNLKKPMALKRPKMRL